MCTSELLVVQGWIKNFLGNLYFIGNSVTFNKKYFVRKSSQIHNIYEKNIKNLFILEMTKNILSKNSITESIDRTTFKTNEIVRIFISFLIMIFILIKWIFSEILKKNRIFYQFFEAGKFSKSAGDQDF